MGHKDDSPDANKSGDDILHDPNVQTDDDEELIQLWLETLQLQEDGELEV